jgi:hypothetical protein
MDWLKELLGEELYKQVTEKLGDKKLLLNDGNYIPKEKFNQVNEEKKLLSEQVAEYKKQIEETTTLLKDNEGLKAKFEALQVESKNLLELKDKEISNITKKGLILEALRNAGAGESYEKLLIKNIDIDEAIVQDGKLLNAEKIIEPLKTEFKGLFIQKIIKGNEPGNPGNLNNNDNIDNPFSKETWNLTKQAELFVKDKAAYERLKMTSKG